MPSDSFFDVTETSGLQRLGSGCGSVVAGVVLFIVSFPLLFWNEGRAVRMDRGLKEGAGDVISIGDPAHVDPANEGKLVHLIGRADTNDVLTDGEFGVSEKAIRLERVVEMYQWEEKEERQTEKKLGGGRKTTTHYTYTKEWSHDLIDSHEFAHPEGHDNPAKMRYPSNSWTAKEVRLGGFLLSSGLVSQISETQTIPVSTALLEKAPEELRHQIQIRDGAFYLPQGPDQKEQKIGDLRISHQVVRPAVVSILAKQVKNSFEPYTTSEGTSIFQLAPGEQSAAGMIKTLADQNAAMTWILRVVGFLVMAVGLALCFQPFVAVADVIPILGDIAGVGVMIFAAGVAFLLTLCTIAVGWITYRPWVAVPLLAAAGAGLLGLYFLGGAKRGDGRSKQRKGKGKKKDKRKPQEESEDAPLDDLSVVDEPQPSSSEKKTKSAPAAEPAPVAESRASTIKIRCPNCQKTYFAGQEHFGRKTKCQKCQTIFVISNTAS